MTEPTQDETKTRADNRDPFDKVFGRPSTTPALDWAVFGCLAAGAVGIIKALGMDDPIGILVCLLGSVAAFGLVIYVHLRKG